MKKCVFSLILVFSLMFMIGSVQAISKDFKFVIETIGIPRYNAYNQEINEDVYYTYNIFSYGTPKGTKDKNQRWKDSKYGFWTKNGGSYKGSGTRGEYYILGKSYSGALIYNYYFPMDVIPSTTPDQWTFYSYPGAKDSWKDKTKYKYKEQLDYMKKSKLMFNDISSRSKADNPKYIREYDITPKEIGLSKARLDVAATWKTYGMVSTRRNINGVIYSQVYLVKPMAANAKVKSKLSVKTENILAEDKDELIIPIEYSTEVVNMTDYAKPKHVKEIKSSLYIDGKVVDEQSGSKIIRVGNEYMLIITRDEYPPNKNHSLKISVKGYMHTEFAVDGLMQSEVAKTVKIFVEPKLIIPVKETNLRVVEKNKLNWVVRPLAQISNDTSKTFGFTEAGKYILAKIDLNISRDKISDIEVSVDNEIIEDVYVYDNIESLAIKIKIPKDIEATLYGEYSLREKEGAYFDIAKNEVGSRIKEPHNLRIKFKVAGKEYEEEMPFDTLDSYLSNINTKILRSNSKENDDYIILEDWIK